MNTAYYIFRNLTIGDMDDEVNAGLVAKHMEHMATIRAEVKKAEEGNLELDLELEKQQYEGVVGTDDDKWSHINQES